jgi:ribonuclease HII
MKPTQISENTLAGVDEVGRGPLAGPIVAAAVVLDPAKPITGLKDSKLLSPKKREELCALIKANCTAWAIGRAEVAEIDKMGIFDANMTAMQRAIEELFKTIIPAKILVDGQHCPRAFFPNMLHVVLNPRETYITTDASWITFYVIDGDNLIPEISAASIVAKVTRDAEMIELDKTYPQYGFAKNKGYGTKEHTTALIKHGITPIHRRSFEPVKSLLTK